MYTCEFTGCTYKSSREWNLRRHMESHPLLKCTQCSFTTIHKPDLQQHISSSHLDITKQCHHVGCSYTTKRSSNLLRHQKKHNMKTSCSQCSFATTNPTMLKNHVEKYHVPATCSICNQHFQNIVDMKKHKCVTGTKACQRSQRFLKKLNKLKQAMTVVNPNPRKLWRSNPIVPHQDALEKTFWDFKYVVGEQAIQTLKESIQNNPAYYELIDRDYTFLEDPTSRDPEQFLQSHTGHISNISNFLLDLIGTHKLQITLQPSLSKPNNDGIVYASPYFNSELKPVDMGTDLEMFCNKAYTKIAASIEEYCSEGSGWTINGMVTLIVKACINFTMHGGSKADVSKLSFTKQNDISINVYLYNDCLTNLIVTPVMKPNHVNLLFVPQGDDGEGHYCTMKSLSSFAISYSRHKPLVCPLCHNCFYEKTMMEKHIQNCSTHTPQRVRYPLPGKNILKFKDIHKQLPVPFAAFADFECLLPKFDGASPSPTTTSSVNISLHQPMSFCLLIVDLEQNTVIERVHTKESEDDDVAAKFVAILKEEATTIATNVATTAYLLDVPSEHRKGLLDNATHCGICEQPFQDGQVRVLDHNHRLEKSNFRFVAHEGCNVNYNLKKFKLPLFFHNGSNYDFHLIMQGLGNTFDEVSVIPKTMEKYISINLGNIVTVLDSYNFLSSSLDKLVQSSNPVDLILTCAKYQDQAKQDCLAKKGVMCYEYMQCLERLNETSLPPKSQFYSSLTQSHISEEDYKRALHVWDVFECKTMRDYLELYQISDVYLLADIMLQFRNVSLRDYKLDPCCFFSLPSLSWSAALRYTRVELEQIVDPDMHLMIENMVRGGVSMISQRYALADHTKGDESQYIMYWDATNLYGNSLSDVLPVRDFRWVPEKQVEWMYNRFQSPEHLDYTFPDAGSTGYFLEVDLDYPPQIHDLHSDLPLAPEAMVYDLNGTGSDPNINHQRTITIDMLSPKSRDLLQTMKQGKVKKLVPNLFPKVKYVLHYRNLKYYLAHGMKLTKIHRVIRFYQQPWLAPYVKFNTQKRREASTEFLKSLYKLIINAVFGKSLQNNRKHRQVQICLKPERAAVYAGRPSVVSFNIINPNLVLIQNLKEEVLLDRPIYTGSSVLDLSKLIMYNFHYDYVVPKYGANKVRLLFTDTDSLCYIITTRNIYDDINKDKERWFDTSNYPRDHPAYHRDNMKKLGTFTDETAGVPIMEFVGLKPKLYAFVCGGEDKKTAKGVSAACKKNQLCFQRFKQCLHENNVLYGSMTSIQSINHQLITIERNKICLSPFDSKKWLNDDGISTRALGHHLNC